MISSFGYRTKLMTLKHAVSFFKCLLKNPRFENVSMHVQNGKHFLYYEPTNPTRKAFLLSRSSEARISRAVIERGNYEIRETNAGVWAVIKKGSQEGYIVTAKNCTCPDFQNRCFGRGLRCKHQIMCIG